MSDCLFCKFVSGEFKTEKVYEDENMIIIRDINPQAKNHFLAIPREHFKLIADANEKQVEILGKCIKKISELTDLLELKGGYRLVINQGDDAGQSVFHLHIHILSGQKMGWQPA